MTAAGAANYLPLPGVMGLSDTSSLLACTRLLDTDCVVAVCEDRASPGLRASWRVAGAQQK